MCQTFKQIKFLFVNFYKDDLKIAVKKLFGQTIQSNARAFQSSLKLELFDL